MKIFPQLQLDTYDQRARAKIKFQGFQQGISYGKGEVLIGPYTFVAGVDFDTTQSDIAVCETLRDAIVNKNCEFWAETDYDNAYLNIFCKKLGAVGNNYPISSTLDPQACIVWGPTLLDGLDEYVSPIYDFSEIESPSSLEITLRLWYINGGDVSSQVKIIVEQAIDRDDDPFKVSWIPEFTQFKPVGFDANNNLKDNIQKLVVKGDDLFGNKFRYRVVQTGENVSAGFYLNALVK